MIHNQYGIAWHDIVFVASLVVLLAPIHTFMSHNSVEPIMNIGLLSPPTEYYIVYMLLPQP